jgi:hypothetical protein
MANTTILDVSQYARLWRGIWWVQHLSMLLALVGGDVLDGPGAGARDQRLIERLEQLAALGKFVQSGFELAHIINGNSGA